MSGRWGWIWTGCAVLGLSACGGAYYRPARDPETCGTENAVEQCERRLAGYAQQLDGLVGPDPRAPQAPASGVDELAGGAPMPSAAPQAEAYTVDSEPDEEAGPDCDAARDLRDRICELAAAICELAAKPDAAQQTKTSCESGSESCRSARRRVADACGE